MIKNNLNLVGEYRYEVRRNGNIVEESDWFHNVILLQGLNRLGLVESGNATTNVSRIGTGTSAPTNIQTQLDAQVASSTYSSAISSSVNSGSPNYITTLTFGYPYAQGAVVGNMTEIGTGWSSTGATLFSRALILDSSGNPTSITITAIDQLTVYYRLSAIPDLSDKFGVINIGGVNYNYTLRPRDIGTYMKSTAMFTNPQIGFPGYTFVPLGSSTSAATTQLSAITTSPALSGVSGTSTAGTYSSNSYFRDDVFNWSISQGNATGGVGIFLYGWGGPVQEGTVEYQMRVDTPVPKDDTKTMSLTARIAWAAL